MGREVGNRWSRTEDSPTTVWYKGNKKTQKSILSCQLIPHSRKQRHMGKPGQEIWWKEWGFLHWGSQRERQRQRENKSPWGASVEDYWLALTARLHPALHRPVWKRSRWEGREPHHPVHNPVITWVQSQKCPSQKTVWTRNQQTLTSGPNPAAALSDLRAKNCLHIVKVL